MTPTSLVLAAHGSNAQPQVNARMSLLAKALEADGMYARVEVAFHQGGPRFSNVLDQLPAGRVVVVPYMTSSGYYCDEVLPRELRKNKRFDSSSVQISSPVGAHPDMETLIAKRVQTLIEENRLCAAELAVLLVGHGTRRHLESRHTTEAIAEGLRGEFKNATVLSAFIDDDPSVEAALASTGQKDCIIIPFFMSEGLHALGDLPGRLEIDPSRNGGPRRLVLDRPIGLDDGVVSIIKTLAKWKDPSKTLRLGTRSSKMALWQANHVADLLCDKCNVEIIGVSTCGDRDLSRPIEELPSAAPFADDIESVLIDGRIDMAVHSLKDLPLVLSPHVKVAAILPRGDARECIVTHDRVRLSKLKSGAAVGTSSTRRAAQLRQLRSDLRVVPLRGPVDDRVRQVRDGRLDAAILAVAGLQRLGLLDEADEIFEPDAFLPAPGQAALAVQIRADDARLLEIVSGMDDIATRVETSLELSLQRAFEDIPGVAVAAFADSGEGGLTLHARIMERNSDAYQEVRVSGESADRVLASALDQLNHLRATRNEALVH